MKSSVDPRTTVGFALVLLLMLCGGIVAARNSLDYIETNRLVVQTHEVLQMLENTLAMMTDAETAQRGFIITGDESFLEPYRATRAQIGAQLAALRQRIAGNPDQQQRLNELVPLIQQRLVGIETGIARYRREGFEAVQERIRAGTGKEVMDNIRALIARMMAEETSLLTMRTEQSASSARFTLLAIGLITVVTVGVISALYYLLYRENTRRQQSEAALAKERTLLRTVIDTVPAYIYVKDRQSHFVLTNAIHARFMGAASPDEAIGKTDFDFFVRERAAEFYHDEQRIMETGQPVLDKEEVATSLSGESIFVSTSKIPLRDSGGNIVQIVGITHDITERKRYEREIEQLNDHLTTQTSQLEAANRELESFSYSVSHDLRAPLRALDGYSRILMDEHSEQLSPGALRYLRLISDNARQMGALVDDLLAFSRLNRKTLHREQVAPATLARQAFDELQTDLQERVVEISIADLPECWADRSLLKQVFVNLISNAVKFTGRRDVACIQIGYQDLNGEPVYFVRDNGAGFDMRYVNKLFGVFQRLHRAEDYEGTGVGLATVQRIVQRHGGNIWAEGEVDKGATFYFTLGGSDPHE